MSYVVLFLHQMRKRNQPRTFEVKEFFTTTRVVIDPTCVKEIEEEEALKQEISPLSEEAGKVSVLLLFGNELKR